MRAREAPLTDDIDRAQAREAELLADALRDHARRVGRGWGAVSAEDCGGCGEVIPVARRRAVPGVQVCVACQECQERRERMVGR